MGPAHTAAIRTKRPSLTKLVATRPILPASRARKMMVLPDGKRRRALPTRSCAERSGYACVCDAVYLLAPSAATSLLEISNFNCLSGTCELQRRDVLQDAYSWVCLMLLRPITADLALIWKVLLVVHRVSSRVLGERCGVCLHVCTTPIYADKTFFCGYGILHGSLQPCLPVSLLQLRGPSLAARAVLMASCCSNWSKASRRRPYCLEILVRS